MNILFHTFPTRWLHYLPPVFFSPSTCVQRCNILNDNRLTLSPQQQHSMQITQIIPYAGMMVLHKGTLESRFLILLGGKKLTSIKIQAYIATSRGHGGNSRQGWGQSQRLQTFLVTEMLDKSLTLPTQR